MEWKMPSRRWPTAVSQEAGKVCAQVGGQLVAGLGAVPDRVLLSTGENGDGLGQLRVGGELTVNDRG